MSHDLNKIERHVVITNGFNVIHGPIYNSPSQQTTTGQPFMITSNTREEVIDLFFSEYLENWIDSQGNTHDEDGNVYTEETGYDLQITKTKRPIDWDINYSVQSQAQDVCNLVDIASNGYFKIRPIKHPTKDIWATPYQEYILNSLPESAYKTQLIELSNYSINKGNRRTEQQMIEEGWVNGT
jgi:hypothetical protein